MLISLVLSILAAPATSEPTFEVLGLGEINGELTRASWERQPTASGSGNVQWDQLPHEATFRAECAAQRDGALKACRIYDTLPQRLTQGIVGYRFLQQLKLSPSSAKAFGGKAITVYMLLRNPAGTDRNVSFCGDPFCISTPPPPPVPDPSPDRG